MISAAHHYDVVIAGAGPAGTSAAIYLAVAGARVLLAEEKKFPRPKLCGEFISPECLTRFEQLGVAQEMMSSGGAYLGETVFYSRGGRSVSVPSQWFGGREGALGLSRAEMDNNLLERAKSVGVKVLEQTQASNLLIEGNQVRGVQLRSGAALGEYGALVTIDATGRKRALARRLDQKRSRPKSNSRPSLVAFKTHLNDARLADRTCEIYFYQGGYGGLSTVEDGLSNLCFIVSARDVRRFDSEPEKVMREVVLKNSRAAHTLFYARARTEWLSVSLESFGRHTLVPRHGLLTIGDAASFIDPFTGSGMLMALESGALAAQVIIRSLEKLKSGESFESVAREYQREYAEKFNVRLRTCEILRRAAFIPGLSEAAILFFAGSDRLRRRLARATRHSSTRVTVSPDS